MDNNKDIDIAKRREEIDVTLEIIRTVWMKNPHLRLGQIIENIKNGTDLYYIGDKDLSRRIKDFYSKDKEEEKSVKKNSNAIMPRDDLLRIAKSNGYDADCNNLRIKLFRRERYTEDVNLIEIAEDVADTLYFSTEKCDEKDLIVFGAAIAYAKTKLEYR